jgi:hypothetical protein
VLLDRALGRALPARANGAIVFYLTGLSASAVLLVYGTSRLFPGTLSGQLVDGHLAASSPWLGAALCACGALCAVYTAHEYGGPVTASDSTFEAKYELAILSLIGLSSAFAVLLVGRDLSTSVSGDIEGQARLMHLFTYNYRRVWPSDSLNFNGILRAFTLLAALLSLASALPSLRKHALALFTIVAVLWTAWGIDIYLVKVAPHWGQRETLLAYYAARKGPQEPFVAYQMNWKGENFYSGNRVPAFVSSGAKFKTWLAEQKQRGVKVMFFTTEHSRISSLKSELGPVKGFEVLTPKALNNKFTLARAEFGEP